MEGASSANPVSSTFGTYRPDTSVSQPSVSASRSSVKVGTCDSGRNFRTSKHAFFLVHLPITFHLLRPIVVLLVTLQLSLRNALFVQTFQMRLYPVNESEIVAQGHTAKTCR